MVLVFHGVPFVKGQPRLAVWLQGRDEAVDCYVDCRVTHKALIDCCGARGIANDSRPGRRVPTAPGRRRLDYSTA